MPVKLFVSVTLRLHLNGVESGLALGGLEEAENKGAETPQIIGTDFVGAQRYIRRCVSKITVQGPIFLCFYSRQN